MLLALWSGFWDYNDWQPVPQPTAPGAGGGKVYKKQKTDRIVDYFNGLNDPEIAAKKALKLKKQRNEAAFILLH